MWAKVLSNVIISVLTALASKLFEITQRYFKRKKRVEKTEEAAKEVENAKTQDEVLASVDNLP